MCLRLKAKDFAMAAHCAIGQKRKYTGSDYYTHPYAVAHTLINIGAPDEVIAAAFLHDVVEDTQITLSIIECVFGRKVRLMVEDLTDTEEGNRATRKRLARERLSKASAWTQEIKCADIIDNAYSIKEYDPKFWKVYRAECVELVAALTKATSLRVKALEALA